MLTVIDTSAVIAVLTNEAGKQALIDATRQAELVAPASLVVEIGNAFSAMFKRERISLQQARHALDVFRGIPIQQVDVDLESALELAYDLGIYAYDAYMIACALRYKAPLLTLDGGLAEAARRVGVSVVEVTT